MELHYICLKLNQGKGIITLENFVSQSNIYIYKFHITAAR